MIGLIYEFDPSVFLNLLTLEFVGDFQTLGQNNILCVFKVGT